MIKPKCTFVASSQKAFSSFFFLILPSFFRVVICAYKSFCKYKQTFLLDSITQCGTQLYYCLLETAKVALFLLYVMTYCMNLKIENLVMNYQGIE